MSEISELLEIMAEEERENFENNPLDDTLLVHATLAKELGACDVAITGKWVWAEFKGKPSNEVRTKLKADGWIYCKRKQKWAWRGAPARSKKAMSWSYIVDKYGLRTLEEQASAV